MWPTGSTSISPTSTGSPSPPTGSDAVMVMEATCYSHDLADMIEELARVLRPGGTLYVKDVFQRSGPLDENQRRDLDRFHEIWACQASATMPALEEAMRGLVSM